MQSKKNAVIALGNSGVGKSFLLNVLVNRNIFEHDTRAGSVTTRIEQYQHPIRIGGREERCTFYNVPGLMEATQGNLSRNESEIQAAFRSNDFQIVLFVIGMEGGRLRAEDCTTFRVLRDTFGFLPESTIFIFNKTSARFNEAAKRETIRIFSSEVGFPVHESKTIFFPNVGDEISMNLSRNLQNPRVTENRNYVLAAIDTSLFSQHRFREEEERLQEELKRVQEETRKNTVIQKLTVYRAKQNQITNELASLHGFLCEVANRHHNRIHADYGLRHKKRSEEIIAFRRSRSYEFNQRCSSDQLENQLLEWYRQSRRDRDELNEFTVGVTNSVNIHQDARNKADGQRLLAQWNVCLSRITEDDDSSRCVIC